MRRNVGRFYDRCAGDQVTDLQQRIENLSLKQRQELADLIARDSVETRIETRSGRKQLCAYVTLQKAESQTDTTIFRDYLVEKLPTHMVPDNVTIIDSIPRLPNGKLDVRALPDPSPVIRHGEDGPTEPTNETERILAKIWSELLGLDLISIHDNFFEVGGDSITSIQIVSRAREAGLQVEPRQLADHPTIAGLAAAIAANTKQQQSRDERRTGFAPLSPIQAWFLNRNLTGVSHWNQANLYEIHSRLNAETIAAAIDECVAHHDALRAVFRNEDGQWNQNIADQGSQQRLEVLQFSNFEASEFESVAASRLSGFDLEHGPLIRFVFFEYQDTQPARLLVVAHHLVIDHVSWSILTTDLERLCQQTLDGQKHSLPAKTSSLIEWTSQLTEWAKTQECREAASYWKNAPAPPELSHSLINLPIDFDDAAEPNEQSAETVELSLSKEATQSLLTEVNQAYNTQTNDILLTALALTLSEWTKSSSVKVDLEGHGRESLFDDIDLSNTIGWLTSFFPITVNMGHNHDCAAAIKTVKELLRSLPNLSLIHI